MNKPLSIAELESSVCLVPLPMSRRDKLMRFAQVVRASGRMFFIFHGLEYYTQVQLKAAVHPSSAFAAAAADPILQDAGLKGAAAIDAMGFFELSQQELHEFSCDCGGVISNAEMADRIERLAEGPSQRVPAKRMFGFARRRDDY